MSKPKIILGLVAIMGLGLMMWWGRPDQPTIPNVAATNLPPILTVTTPLYNFGTISMANGVVSKIFSVANNTGQNLTVEKLFTSCMCTSAYWGVGPDKKGPFGMPGHATVPNLNEIIKAGETKVVEVVYNPAAHGPAGIGPIDRFVYLQDDQGKQLLRLEIKAIVTP